MMKEQHKGMFIALRGGGLDDLLEQVCGPLPGPPEPISIGPRSRSSSLPALVEDRASSRVAVPPPPPALLDSLASAPASARAGGVSEPPSSAGRRRQRTLSNPNLRRIPPSIPPTAPFDVDVDALGRAIAGESVAPPGAELERASVPDLASAIGGTEPRRRTPSGRYAASRPSPIFAQPPSPERQSLFGEDVISEKSLDEVILSYLAEDLDGSSQD
jgi:hypothetical protein